MVEALPAAFRSLSAQSILLTGLASSAVFSLLLLSAVLFRIFFLLRSMEKGLSDLASDRLWQEKLLDRLLAVTNPPALRLLHPPPPPSPEEKLLADAKRAAFSGEILGMMSEPDLRPPGGSPPRRPAQ